MPSRGADVALRHCVSAACRSARGQQRWKSAATEESSRFKAKHDSSINSKYYASNRAEAPRHGRATGSTVRSYTHSPQAPADETSKLSLVDRLFPNAADNSIDNHTTETRLTKPRELPLLPLDDLLPRQLQSPRKPLRAPSVKIDLEYMPDLDPETLVRQNVAGQLSPIIRVQNASKNLTIADFRRLVPQSRHIEGWTLQAIDILSVTAVRQTEELAHTGSYLLLFTSPFAAQKYLQNAQQLHAFIQAHGAQDASTEALVGPLFGDLDISAAKALFAVLSRDQRLSFYRLKSVEPRTARVIASNGHVALRRRQDRMPFELRLQLDGPQLPLKTLRDTLLYASKAHGVSWSADYANRLPMSRWTTSGEQTWSTAPPVYIVGFQTEAAAHTFFHYWQKRPLVSEDDGHLDLHNELPPIVELEMLW